MVSLSDSLTTCWKDELEVTQALQLPEGPNGPMLRRGPAYQGFVAVAARLVELVFDDALIHGRPGGLLIDHMLAGMRGFVPELPAETHLEIIQTFVARRSQEMAAGGSVPMPSLNPPQRSTAQRLKQAMLSLEPEVQRHVMVNFVALSRNEPVIGKIHPLAKMLLEQSEATVKDIIDAMLDQVKAKAAAAKAEANSVA